ncbi:unnamed protein product, partial [Ectocarpus sp. 8 AP-2014]
GVLRVFPFSLLWVVGWTRKYWAEGVEWTGKPSRLMAVSTISKHRIARLPFEKQSSRLPEGRAGRGPKRGGGVNRRYPCIPATTNCGPSAMQSDRVHFVQGEIDVLLQSVCLQDVAGIRPARCDCPKAPNNRKQT